MKKLLMIILIALLAVGLVFIVIVFGKGKGDTSSKTSVILNEVMTKNDMCPDKNGEYFDWVELHNTANESVDISAWGLSDNLISGVKYVIPAGTSIEANGYLVIFCSGAIDEQNGQLYAGFKLSDTDDLVLYGSGGSVVDSMTLAAAGDGYTYARENGGDNWKQLAPSPGYENSDAGIAAYNEYLQSLSLPDGDNGNQSAKKSDIDYLVINELMASNATVISDGNGEFSDWLEIANTSDKEVNLAGFFVSDDKSKPQKYMIPDGVTIDANGYLLIFMSGNAGLVGSELHVPFGFAAYEEDAVLSDNTGAIIDSVSFAQLEVDCSYARTPDKTGEFSMTSKPTPSYENTEEAFNSIAAQYKPGSPVYISEMLGQNKTTYARATTDGRTVYCDWAELYNSSSEPFDISGFGLTTNPKNPAKWLFPENTVIPAGYRIVVVLTDNENYTFDKSVLHAKFNLSAAGETLYLFDAGGKFLDKLSADRFVADMSIGREADYSIRYYYTPTPGLENAGETALGLCSYPGFLTVPGIYDDTVTVELSCGAGEKIFYTTDCSTPTQDSILYNEPITISKNTAIRAVCYRDGYCSKYSEATGTYLFKSDNASHSLPVLSVVTDDANLWDADNGMYTYGRKWQEGPTDTWPYAETPANFWKDVEYEASFEVFSDDENKQVFQQNIGISISGAFGRGREQKGIAISARDEYGSNRMEYPFFDKLPYTSYKSLVLRCGAQDQANGKIRDELSVAVFEDYELGFLYQEYKPYILYLNGKYWGVYFMREKRNRFFVTQHDGVADNTDVTLVKSETRANYGTTDEWKGLMNYARTHDLNDKDAYKYIADRIDLDSFRDYIICETYVGNSDYWNIQMYKAGGGKWRFIYYDFCWGWNEYTHMTLAARRAPAQPCSDFFNALLAVPSWRNDFIERFAELANTVFDEAHVLSKIEELDAQVRPEIERERKIFNSADSPYFSYVDPANYSTFERYVSHIDKIKAFAKNRRTAIIEQIQSEFGLSDERISELFG